MEKFSEAEKIYTVLELNDSVRIAIRSEFPGFIWVCGEIQDFRASRDKRHIYFSLVQKHPQKDQIVAKVNAAIFETRKQRIFERIKDLNSDFELRDDIEVKFLCQVDLYPKTGSFSIIVVDIDPVYTLGRIAQSRQKIIDDLRKKGLIDLNKARSLPLVPLKVGLITALDSAAYHDFTNELKASGYSFEVLLYNCHMQGRLVEKDVLGALSYFNSLERQELDVIVITRGGGATADLSYFDNKNIAQGVAASNFPVISALGHQINVTVTDIVAHTFCKTPTKAADVLIRQTRQVIETFDSLQEQISKCVKGFLDSERKDLLNLTIKMEAASSRYFRFHQENLLNKKHAVLNSAAITLTRAKESVKKDFSILSSSLEEIFKHFYNYLKHADEKIKILDPKNALKRGYSITFKGEKAVKNFKEIHKGDIIRTVLYRGEIISGVKEAVDKQ